MKFGVIVFPGSNCDADCYHVVRDVLGQEADYIWHKEGSVSGCDALILPGASRMVITCVPVLSPAFPHNAGGNRLRQPGGLVIGICNGFQILLEAGLLPGAMLRNRSLKFICNSTNLKVQRTDTAFTNQLLPDEIIKVPIAHGEGNYFCDQPTLAALKESAASSSAIAMRTGWKARKPIPMVRWPILPAS